LNSFQIEDDLLDFLSQFCELNDFKKITIPLRTVIFLI
jgi:hypothetical protein